MKSDQFEAIFDSLDVPCLILRPDAPRFEILSVNQAALYCTNSQKGDLIGRGIFEVLPDNPADLERTGKRDLQLSLEQVMAAKAPHKAAVEKYYIRDKENSGFETRYYSYENSPIFDKHGEVELIVQLVIDLTDQVLAEKKEEATRNELLNKQKQYQSLFDHNPDAVFSFDLEGNFTNANQGLVTLAECPIETILETTFVQFIALEDLARVTEHFKKACAGEVQNYNTDIITAKGNFRKINATKFPIVVNNEIVGVYGIAKDITKVAEAEQNLQASIDTITSNERRFRALMRNSTEGIVLIAADGTVLETSFTAMEILSIKNDVVRKMDFNIAHPDDIFLVKSAFEEVVNLPNHIRTVEFRLKKDDGTFKWIEVIFHNQLNDSAVLAVVANLRDITERMIVVETLKSSEELYRNLFDNNPMPMWIYDRESFRFLEVNQAAVQKYGYSREEFLKLKITQIRPEEDIGKLMDLKLKSRSFGSRYEGFWRHLKKNGELLYVDIASHMISREGHDAILILAHDITEKVNAEKAKQKSEEIKELIMDSDLNAIICMDTDGLITLWNTQAENLFGWTKDEMLGKELDRYLIPEAYRQRHREGLKRYRESGAGPFINNVIEINALNRTQTEFPIELFIVPIEQNGSVFFCAFIRDITERKHYTQALKLSGDRFKALVQEGSDLISILDRKGRFKYLSPAYNSMLGIKPEEMIGKSVLDKIHEEDRDIISKTFELLKKESRITSLPFRYKGGNDQYRWLEAVGTNLLNDPAVEGIVINSKDITERINYIQEIENQNKKLKEIAWFQSHVVRSPLTRIMSIIDLINNYAVDSEKTKELLNALLSSAHDLDAIIKDIVRNTEQVHSKTDNEFKSTDR